MALAGLKIVKRKTLIGLATIAAITVAIGAGNYRALSNQNGSPIDGLGGDTVAQEGDWVLRKQKDDFSGKTSCTAFNHKSPHIWVLDGLMIVRYKDRGRLRSYSFRIDDREVDNRSDISVDESKFDAAIFLTSRTLAGGKRLRVRASTYSGETVDDDINLSTLWLLEDKRSTLCSV